MNLLVAAVLTVFHLKSVEMSSPKALQSKTLRLNDDYAAPAEQAVTVEPVDRVDYSEPLESSCEIVRPSTPVENVDHSNYEDSFESTVSSAKHSLWNVSSKEARTFLNFPRVILQGSVPGKIALTFDDGLSLNTLKVLEVLREYGIKATFFILGNKLEKEFIDDGADGEEKRTPQQLIDQILAEGHEVASHSFSHPSFLELEDEQIIQEMTKTAINFEKLIGKKPRLMRPPYGYLDRRVADLLDELGFFIILWSVDTQDWKEDTALAIDNFKHLVNPDALNSSEIVLMHDNQKRINVYLREIIKHAQELGFTFAKVSEILGGINPYFCGEQEARKIKSKNYLRTRDHEVSSSF